MATGLATRCSACGTVFRVVPDQLRVSEGWVRCGRCSQVFNAVEALLDLETGAARRLPEEALVPRSPPPPSPREPVFDEYRVDDHRHNPPAPAQAAPRPPPPPPYRQAVQQPDFDSTAGANMPVVDDSASRFPAHAERPDIDVEIDPDPRAEPDDRPSEQPAEKPAFVRQAERAAVWRSRPVRALLLLLGVGSVLGLAGQVLLEYRDLAAARYAALRPALQTACGWLDCQLSAARSINDLTVESSGLVRVEKSSVYRLSVALKNRAPIEVALPALELALTDAQGQLVARRVLNATELGVNQATLAAGRELTLQATLQAATAPVAGYTIELFYP
jgi:predicted Zn finger-like uncharacterized protein